MMNETTRTLREIETNRLVKVWENEDRLIYECLLVTGTGGDRIDGIVPGASWGEKGWIYVSPLPADRHS